MHRDPPADWPHRQHSRFIEAGGLRWHVQVFESQRLSRMTAPPAGATGVCPAVPAGTPHPMVGMVGMVASSPQSVGLPDGDLLLLHGAGSSAHSWRDIAPALARHGRVLVPDLPGHAFTTRPTQASGLSLPGMADSLAALLGALGASVTGVLGHSAGAAVATRLVLDGAVRPRTLMGLNGAWLSPAGQGRWFYGPLARLFVMNPWTPRFFAFHASQAGPLQRLLASTGSRLDARGVALYHHLVSDREHVAAVLAMMAAWDVEPLRRDLTRLAVPLTLLVGEVDRTVPPAASMDAMRRAPRGSLHRLPGLGHLAHEEAPQEVLAAVDALLAAT